MIKELITKVRLKISRTSLSADMSGLSSMPPPKKQDPFEVVVIDDEVAASTYFFLAFLD